MSRDPRARRFAEDTVSFIEQERPWFRGLACGDCGGRLLICACQSSRVDYALSSDPPPDRVDPVVLVGPDGECPKECRGCGSVAGDPCANCDIWATSRIAAEEVCMLACERDRLRQFHDELLTVGVLTFVVVTFILVWLIV